VVALALVGPTASGKSALALELARRRPGLELVSVDSMQVYRGMDIGTAKPSPADQAEVRHHLIDLVEPSEEYTVSRYSVDLAAALADIAGRGQRAVLVGGTGLYVRAALGDLEIPPRYPAVRAQLEVEADPVVLHRRLEQLDPVAAARMEPANRRRVVRALEVTLGSGRAFSSFGPGLGTYPPLGHPMVGLGLDREALDRRIEQRYQDQLAAGFLQEVATLAASDAPMSPTAAQALGYRELQAHLAGQVSLEEAVELAVRRTRRFERRQERWFRRDPRIDWVAAGHNALADTLARLGD
jgi:tRNA dimethylallyltransferase